MHKCWQQSRNPWTSDKKICCKFLSTAKVADCAERRRTTDHLHASDIATTSRSTGWPSESVLSSKWHSWFARWLLPRVWQYSALSTVSWRPDLRGTTNIQQLWRQNFCSRWTSFVELFTILTAQSRHHLRTVSTTAEGTPFWEPWTRRYVTSDNSALQKHSLTYLIATHECVRYQLVLMW